MRFAKRMLLALFTATLAIPVVHVAVPEAEVVAEAQARLQYKMLRRALAREDSGCSPEQVSERDPRVAACYRKQDYDAANQLPFRHHVFCTPTSRSCCQVDINTGAVSNCAVIDRRVKSRDAANPGRPSVSTRP